MLRDKFSLIKVTSPQPEGTSGGLPASLLPFGASGLSFPCSTQAPLPRPLLTAQVPQPQASSVPQQGLPMAPAGGPEEMCYSTCSLTRHISLAVHTLLLHHTARSPSFTSSSVTDSNRSTTYNEQKEFYWNVYTQR